MLNKVVDDLARDLYLDTGICAERIEIFEDLKIKDLMKKLEEDKYYMLVWKKDFDSKEVYITIVYWGIGEYLRECSVFRNPLTSLYEEPCLRKLVKEKGLESPISRLFASNLSFYQKRSI